MKLGQNPVADIRKIDIHRGIGIDDVFHRIVAEGQLVAVPIFQGLG